MSDAAKMFKDYAERGEYHREPDPNWEGYAVQMSRMRVIREEVYSIVRKQDKVLDAGCGEGVLLEEMLKNGFDVYGIDQNYTSNSVMRGDITKLPFLDEYFDVVLCFDVLEHLTYEAQDSAISELRRVLKKNGTMLISFPNLAHLHSRLRFLIKGEFNRTSDIKRHPGDRPLKEYISKLAESGFKILKIRGIFPTFPLYFNLISANPKKYLKLFETVTVLFSYPPLCFWNLLVAEKLK